MAFRAVEIEVWLVIPSFVSKFQDRRAKFQDRRAKANLTVQLGDATLRPSQSGLRLTKLRRLKRFPQENASHGGTFG